MTQSDKLQALIHKSGVELPWIGNAGPGDNIEDYCEYVIQNNFENVIIFNHEFAKALFGKELVALKYPMCEHSKQAWVQHLQQAVIAEDPIDYMYEVVFDY